jgi:toxin CcdB
VARYNVYKNPELPGRGYLLDIQADMLSGLASRAMVPLLPIRASLVPIRDFNPVFSILDEPHILLTQAILSLPKRLLKAPVTSLRDRHDDIMRALNILLTGH